jgi:hypothetical protein
VDPTRSLAHRGLAPNLRMPQFRTVQGLGAL